MGLDEGGGELLDVGHVRGPDERRAVGGGERHEVDVMVVQPRDHGPATTVEVDVAGARRQPAVDLDDHPAARSNVDEHPVDDDVAQNQVRHGTRH